MSLTHGNLRSRNILVFKVIKSDILIKIGDPGLVSYFNKMPLTHDYNQERWAEIKSLVVHGYFCAYKEGRKEGRICFI